MSTNIDNNLAINKPANDKSEKSKLAKQIKEPVSLTMKLKTYGLPLLSILIFLLISVFVTLPEVNRIFDLLDQKSAASTALASRQEKLEILKSLSTSQEYNNEILTKLNKIIPTAKTEIVQFSNKISSLAKSNDIVINNIVTGENIFLENKEEDLPNDNLILVQIPMQFKLEGDLDDFRQMLYKIYTSNDFIVISEMELTIGEDGNNSNVEIVLSKYQFMPFSDQSEERRLLDTIPDNQKPVEEVIEFIERKSKGNA